MIHTVVFAIILQLTFAFTMYQFGVKSACPTRRLKRNRQRLQSNTVHLGKKLYAGMDKYMWLSIYFFTFIVAIRYRVGMDCESYVENLDSIAQGIYDENRNGSNYEILSIVFAKIAIFFGNSRVVLLGVYGFLESFFIWYALRRRKYILSYIGLIIILGPLWYSLNNGLRQITVACMFTYAVQQLIDNKDWKKYLIIVAIGYLIHRSSLILLPFVFLIFYNRCPNRWILIILQIVCVVLGSIPILNQYLSLAGAAIEITNYTGYSAYLENLDYYVDQEGLVSHYGPRRIIMLTSYLLVMYKSQEMDKFYKHDQFFRITILLSTIYSCFTELILSSNFIFSRPLLYLKIFVLISQGFLLYYLKAKKQTTFFLVSLIILCSYVIIDNFSVIGVANETSIYKIFLFKDLY